VQGYAVAWHVLAHGRTPVIVLTDAFYRRQRWQAACLSAYRGAVVTFAPRRVITPLFPHGRIIGPLPMPISSERLAWLEQVATEFDHDGTLVQFIGHVYPPRSDFLDAVAERLAVEGISLSVNGDKWGTSNEAYWRTLAAADVVVTTCMQGPERPFMDWIWEQQLVFRYNEALAAGAALVASQVEGSSTFFHPGTDFLEFTSVDEAVTAIVALVRDDDYRRTIAASGHQASTRIIANSVFWTSANEHLSIRMVPA
jgi:glycosyltransferase involved in cell wall biosynthesis